MVPIGVAELTEPLDGQVCVLGDEGTDCIALVGKDTATKPFSGSRSIVVTGLSCCKIEHEQYAEVYSHLILLNTDYATQRRRRLIGLVQPS